VGATGRHARKSRRGPAHARGTRLRLTSIAPARPWRHARTIRFAASGRLGGRRRLTGREARRLPRAPLAQLQLRGSRFTTADLEDVVRSALSGLVQQSAA
jgi:hypothetical protein